MSVQKYKEAFMDVVRWSITILLIPIIFWVVFWSLSIPFEFIVSHTSWFYTLFYVIMWFMIIGPAFGMFFMLFSKVISITLNYFVRQKLMLYYLFNICSLVFICFTYYIVWSDSIMLSWEFFKHPTLNRIIFTIYMTVYVVFINSGISSAIFK